MESKKEYFTPDIKDLRIGYYCEVNANKEYDNDFIPTTITVKDSENTYTNVLNDLVDGLDDGYMDIRVPFLTKEDIESEGWQIDKKRSDNNYTYATKVTYGISELRYDSGNMTLAIYNKYLRGTDESKYPTFYGECKDINTFKWIIELIKI